MRTLIQALVLGVLLPMPDGAMAEAEDKDPVTGEWVYADTEGTVGTQECPDFLTLSNDGHYSVANECAATDPRNPVVEKGTWSVDRAELGRVLVLGNRSFLADQDFLGEGMSPRLRVLEAGGDLLRLEICSAGTANKTCRVEIYRRWTPEE